MIHQKKMPTPETQAAYDAAYMKAVQGPQFWDESPPTKENPTKEEVLLILAAQAGRLAGMDDWALKNGIQTSLLGYGPSGHG